jgi:hypothetical protein
MFHKPPLASGPGSNGGWCWTVKSAERLAAQLLMQDICGGMQQQPHAVGEGTGAGSAVSRQIGLLMLAHEHAQGLCAFIDCPCGIATPC